MSRKRISRKCKASYIFLGTLIVIALVGICIIGELREHLAEITEYRGREAATDIITSAVERTISQCPCEDIYKLTTDGNGAVISAKLNADSANRVKNILTEEVEKGIDKLGEDGIAIPIGTLIGIPLPAVGNNSVDLSVQQIGAVKSEFRSTLETAGINQSRLTVYAVVTVDIRAILPDGHTDISVTEEHIITDCLIVGEVPQSYFGG
ncbi:sporulation protein YunB [Ruminococcus albus]|uniref:Sporulation protein YunB n=1 Tax=Ruminococcus albus TaxID=1264 RepID=A0A1H7F7R1_RUMAL|nr:sporulation protein YunB [Ruminococcus albus]SEK22131.1 sporulation protein YunB [Ruminococcus albus]